MKRPANRLISWLVLLSVLAMVHFSACTPQEDSPALAPSTGLGTPSPTGSFTDFDAFAAEYVDAAQELAETLPEGTTFPPEPPGVWEAGGRFEEGAGEVAAALHWRCAWASAYVASQDSRSPADAIAALDQLAKWSDLSEVRDHSDSETRAKWLERVVEPARNGDDSTLRAIQVECGTSE